MTFLDDSDARLDDHRGLLWGPVRIVAGQLERVVALNLAWGVQLLPAGAGLIMDGWPVPVRAVLITYTMVVLPVTTAMLYAVAGDAVRGDPVTVSAALAALRRLAGPALVTLMPLSAGAGLIGWLGVSLARADQVVAAALAQLAALLVITCAVWWGPLLVSLERPDPRRVAVAAARLVWRRPGRSLAVTGLSVLLGAIGVITGVWLLAGTVLIAIIQTKALPADFAGDRADGHADQEGSIRWADSNSAG